MTLPKPTTAPSPQALDDLTGIFQTLLDLEFEGEDDDYYDFTQEVMEMLEEKGWVIVKRVS